MHLSSTTIFTVLSMISDQACRDILNIVILRIKYSMKINMSYLCWATHVKESELVPFHWLIFQY